MALHISGSGCRTAQQEDLLGKKKAEEILLTVPFELSGAAFAR
jgi:hypothetical protein